MIVEMQTSYDARLLNFSSVSNLSNLCENLQPLLYPIQNIGTLTNNRHQNI